MFIQKLKRLLITLRDDFSYIFSSKENIAVNDEHYEDYWKIKRGNRENGPSSFQKSRARVIQKYIAAHDTILDVGCGDCEIVKLISENIPLTITAADISPWALEKAKKLGFRCATLDASDKNALLELPHFKVILLLEILEHIKNAEQVFNILLSKADNYLIFSIPNSGYYAHRVRFFLGKFPAQWIAHPGEHLRFWTLADMNWWLRALNIKKFSIYTYEGLPWLNNFFPSLFAKGIIVAIPKAENRAA